MRKPAWWAVLVTILGVLIFVRLGIWQLDRANYKVQLWHLFDTAATAPLVPFTSVMHVVPANTYPHVAVHGHFLQGHEYLLVNKTHANRTGVEIYAPFVVDHASRMLLVDLGFLPRTRTHALPHLPPLKQGQLVVKGLYAKAPRPGFKMGGNRLPLQHSWPKTTIFIDLGDLGADVGNKLFPRVLLMDPNPDKAYIRVWVPDTMPPARHRAYAFQWFTFAVAAIAIFWVLNRRHRKDERESDETDE